MKKLIKIIVAIIGVVIALNGVTLFFVSNANLGNLLTVLLGVFILFTTLFFSQIAKWLKTLVIAGISVAILFSSFLVIYGKSDTVTYKEDAVIVLGAAVHGTTPSLTLKKRLDKAVEYHEQNPDAIIIVSGGQGNGEDITEAAAMEKYLVEHGVNPNKITKEDRSTSTLENFVFSKEILDNYFEEEYTTCFVTNEYHVLRAADCAKSVGIFNASHLHSNTNLSYLISGSLRECLAVIKYTVFNN